MTTYYMTAGDTLPVLDAVLHGGDGRVVDLTGSTVTFRAASTLGGAAILSGAATLPNGGADGLVRFTPATAPSQAGVYLVQWLVTFPGGGTQHFPNRGVDQLVVSAAV